MEVVARHHRQRRFPNGSEMTRQLTRGQPVQMVERVEHEWAVIRDGRNVGSLRENPNGTFSLGPRYTSRPGQGLVEAAVAAARRVMGAPRQDPGAAGDAEEANSAPGPR